MRLAIISATSMLVFGAATLNEAFKEVMEIGTVRV